MKRLMIADGSDVVRKVGRKILAELGFQVADASSGREALALCERELPHFLIVDAAMDDALDLITNVRALPNGKDVRIYYCVIEAELKVMMAGKRAGANDFLLKPFDRQILTATFGDKAMAA
ncbi:response regulator [Rhizobium glycinendophyticum]|uniref:Response regulator n=1 Tax=Rhizobium glycinendophyticum TaxID=2589807 RepID=A0A504UFM9_9HYPH|nr:response regulator [Rhizobium glycinendophyticum]TPP11860.1 response regulator [Rhizobium glycinendophyticum]